MVQSDNIGVYLNGFETSVFVRQKFGLKGLFHKIIFVTKCLLLQKKFDNFSLNFF